ncbi:MAG: PocR ligand-binding domain-containing protein, partial [Clostridia bacterium]|nr:PocR ligand-binding domain-containing protein [Clostridia bacterium]
MHIYKCHAGLVEAAMPIKNENKIIGYMMLG